MLEFILVLIPEPVNPERPWRNGIIMDNILERIQSQIDGLSKGQKRIAHYIIENLDDAAFMTALKIGRAVNVSESTVVRFAKNMGYDGFPEFQDDLVKALKEKINSANRIDINNSGMSHSKLLQYVFENDAQNIRDTLSSIDTDSFDMAVDTIVSARKVYIAAVRSAAPLADFLAFYLRISIDNVIEVTSNSLNEMIEQMINVSQNDVVIGISFPRYSIRTLKAMEFANSHNARVIAITDSAHSPMNLYSSCNLFAKSNMASVVDSLTAPMSLINALVVAVCMKNSRKVVKNLEELDRIWDDYQVTGGDEINFLDDKLLKDLKGLR